MQLGWIPPSKITTFSGSAITRTIDRIEYSTTGYHTLKIKMSAMPTSVYFLVETRQKVGFDVHIPSSAPDHGVLITKIDESKGSGHGIVREVDQNPATKQNYDGDAVWQVGQIYTDGTYGFSVAIQSWTGTGFAITVTGRTPSLTVTLMLPANGGRVQSPVELMVRVASGGRAVSGATVRFFVNSVEVGSGLSAVTGYASYFYSAPSSGSYGWYATAEKSGYSTGTSPTRSFTVFVYSAHITGVSVAPDPGVVGSRVTFTVTVQNTGSDIASAIVKVTIHKPGGALAATLSKPISAFTHLSTRSVDVVYTLPVTAPTGTWTYDVFLYRLTTLLDDDIGRTFTVVPRVISGSITVLSVTPNPVTHGTPLAFSVTVKNTGNFAWASARVVVKVKSAANVLLFTRTVAVTNLQAGQERVLVPISWLVPRYPDSQLPKDYTYTVELYYGTTLLDQRFGGGTIVT